MLRDGGPAFPRAHGGGMASAQNGMSLRDWFAGQALAGKLAGAPNNISYYAPAIAYDAYVMADAMLAAREKPVDNTSRGASGGKEPKP